MSRSAGDGGRFGGAGKGLYVKAIVLVVAGLVVGAVLATILVRPTTGKVSGEAQAILICQYAKNGQTAGPVEGGRQLSALSSGAFGQQIVAIADLSLTDNNPKYEAVVNQAKAFGRATTATESAVLGPSLVSACNAAGFPITAWQPGQ